MERDVPKRVRVPMQIPYHAGTLMDIVSVNLGIMELLVRTVSKIAGG